MKICLRKVLLTLIILRITEVRLNGDCGSSSGSTGGGGWLI